MEELFMTKTQVNFQIFDEDKNGKLYETENSKKIDIKAIRPAQFGALMRVLNKTFKELKENKEFTATVSAMFGKFQEGFDFEDLLRDEDFNLFNALDAIGYLLETVPERLYEIIGIASNIPVKHLEQQEMDVFFDIVEAILEVNDMEKLVDRIKVVWNRLGKTFKLPQMDQATGPKVAK